MLNSDVQPLSDLPLQDKSSSDPRNALLQPWTGPFGGVPAFDKVRVEDFEPAVKIAVAEQLAEIQKIADNPETPTFQNTFVPLEEAGETIARILCLFEVYSGTRNDEAMQAVALVVDPMLVEASDKIVQNTKLFSRIAQLYDNRDNLNLTAEQRRLVEDYYKDGESTGARLPTADKLKMAAINQQLSELTTKFSQNLLNEESSGGVELRTPEDLAGLSESVIEAYRIAARDRESDAAALIPNNSSSVEPFLEYSTRRDLRERVWRAYVSRGDNGDELDNNRCITEILALRKQNAQLLGFETYAHWNLENTMARTPEVALEFMTAMWPAALKQSYVEIGQLQAVCDRECIDAEVPCFTIEPWDWRFYAEKLRKETYGFDAEDLRPYLQLHLMQEAMFWVARELFDLRFVEVPAGSVPLNHPDVKVFEVQQADGSHVGLWYFDAYSRKHKESGAWMSEYRSQENLNVAISPIVTNAANFGKGAAGEPVLISWEDAKTLFHEFGHALHGLLSKVTYCSLAGTNVRMDFVEFPSQFMENYLGTQEVLSRFARHYQSAEPMPQALIAKVTGSAMFLQGIKTIEYMASAFLDMRMHLAAERIEDPRRFERQNLEALGMPTQIAVRHRPAHFGHIFSSPAYAAFYYSYLWAEVLAADAWEAFLENGGPLDPYMAKRLRAEVLSVGDTREPGLSFRSFRGKDPEVGALMRARNLA